MKQKLRGNKAKAATERGVVTNRLCLSLNAFINVVLKGKINQGRENSQSPRSVFETNYNVDRAF